MEPKKTLIAYIDGFNLYNGMHDAFGHRFLWLDLVQLLAQFRPNHQILKIKYFTAPLLDDPEAQSRQATYWNALEAQSGGIVEIVSGRYQRSEKQCKSCSAKWTHYEEKETDVNMAISLVIDAAKNEATDYYLISGDSDAAPAIRQAMKVNPAGFYMALFPPRRTSNELQGLMPRSMVIGREKLAQSQLPEIVRGAKNAKYSQPAKWKAGSFETP